MRKRWTSLAGTCVLFLAACGGGVSPSGRGDATTSSRVIPTQSGSSTPNPSRAPTVPLPTSRPAPTHTTAPPSAGLPPVLRDGVVTRFPVITRSVVLTFDAGAGSQGAASILATLRAQGVPASFFVTGRFANDNPSLTRQMAAIGTVGNHTWSHTDLTTLKADAISRELSSTRSAILAATGRDPRPLFRFPYGAYDSRVLALVHTAGYGAVGWTTDSLGWKGTSGGMSVTRVVARVLAGCGPGQIVLMHVGANPDDGTTLDAAALPQIISAFRARGYGFTSLAGLLG